MFWRFAESNIAKGKSAAFAWKKAVTTHADRLAALRNQLLAQRANDLRDVGLRVLAILTWHQNRAAEISAECHFDCRRSHPIGHGGSRPDARDGLFAPRVAAPLRTWRFSPAPSGFPRSRASNRRHSN
jgi:hypothetical protein